MELEKLTFTNTGLTSLIKEGAITTSISIYPSEFSLRPLQHEQYISSKRLIQLFEMELESYISEKLYEKLPIKESSSISSNFKIFISNYFYKEYLKALNPSNCSKYNFLIDPKEVSIVVSKSYYLFTKDGVTHLVDENLNLDVPFEFEIIFNGSNSFSF